MRLLYFAYVDLNTPSACQTHTLGLLRGFAAQGCRVDAVVPRPAAPLGDIPGVRFHYLAPYSGRRRQMVKAILVSTWTLFRLARQHSYAALYARDMDIFVGVRWCCRHFGLPLFLEIDDSPVEGSYPPWLRRLVARNLAWDYRQADGLIVPAVPRGRLIAKSFGVPREKIHIVLNGSDDQVPPAVDRAACRRRWGLPADTFCLGFVGTVSDRYDFATLLAALDLMRPELPQAHLLLVGDGPAMAALQELTASRGLTRHVTCTGFLPPETFPGILPAMDAGLMLLTPPALAEHGPIHTKLGTYAAYRLPVLAAAHDLAGYPPELTRNIIWVPPGDPPALARSLLELARHPDAGRAAAARLATYARQHLTWIAVAGDILKIMAAP